MSGGWLHPITDAEVATLAADIAQQGYATLRNYVSQAELKPIRKVARTAIRASGGEYALQAGPDAVSGTILSELPHSAPFRNLCRRLLELKTGTTAPEVGFYQTLRCLRGGTRQSRIHSHAFHYDGFILTAVLGVDVPQRPPFGDLLIVRKTRRVRQHYVASLFETNFIKFAPVQLFIRRLVRLRVLDSVVIRLEPGDMYLFWGYQCLHANEPCAPGSLRTTAIFQYCNVHEGSKIGKMIRDVMPHFGLHKPYWATRAN